MAKHYVIRAIEVLKANGAKPELQDGKLTFNTRPTWGHAWRAIKHDSRMNCVLWKTVIYQAICCEQLPKEERFVPIGCQNCYKIVVRPKTWPEFLKLEQYMIEFDHPSKLGVEVRRTVKALYGSYFYNRGLEEGRACYEKIAKTWPTAILKRGCTELELMHGPSDKWQITDLQREIEAEVEKSIRVPVQTYLQDEKELNKIHRRWENFAWKFDPTYEGEDLFPKYVTYH